MTVHTSSMPKWEFYSCKSKHCSQGFDSDGWKREYTAFGDFMEK